MISWSQNWMNSSINWEWWAKTGRLPGLLISWWADYHLCHHLMICLIFLAIYEVSLTALIFASLWPFFYMLCLVWFPLLSFYFTCKLHRFWLLLITIDQIFIFTDSKMWFRNTWGSWFRCCGRWPGYFGHEQ